MLRAIPKPPWLCPSVRSKGGPVHLAAVPLSIASQALAAKKPPNVLLIWLDDVGKQGLDFYPQWGTEEFPALSQTTPALSAFAADSRIFDNGRSTPICWSSRMEALTGKKIFELDAQANRWEPNNPFGRCDPIDYLWRYLPGYRSGAFGKWHLHLAVNLCLEHPSLTSLDEYAISYYYSEAQRGRYWGSYWTTSKDIGEEFQLPVDRFVDDEILQASQDFIDRSSRLLKKALAILPLS